MNKPAQIAEGVYIVGGPQITDERDCCVFLLDGGTELALVDAGLGYSTRAIVDNIKNSAWIFPC